MVVGIGDPPKGRSLSRTSSIFGDRSKTWAIDGGRPRFRLAAYATAGDWESAGT